MSVTPDFKPAKRIREDAAGWDELRQAKRGDCRACGGVDAFMEFHHLLRRGVGGDDVANNLIPLCRGCHRCITDALPGYRAVLGAIRHNLTKEELGYLRTEIGEDGIDRLYPSSLNCGRKRTPKEANAKPRPKSRVVIVVPNDAENGAEVLESLIDAARVELKGPLGWQDDVPPYYPLVAVLVDWLGGERGKGNDQR